MIVFDLKCQQNHRFEGWFRSHEDFGTQRAAEAIACPECGAVEIEKALSVPNIGSNRDARSGPSAPAALPRAFHSPDLPPALAAELGDALRRVRAHVEAHCENVGARFAEEARRIHYGETDARGIYGIATPEESRALVEEGIEILPLPIPPKTDA